MQVRTIYGREIDKAEAKEITIELKGRGGATGVKCLEKLVAQIRSFKMAKTPQEVYDRFVKVCGYCACCKDAGFIDATGADELMYMASVLAGVGQKMTAKGE
jgi:hypothetical protein